MKRDEVPTRLPGHQKASAAVTAALGTLPYPVTKHEAIARVGDWQVPLDKDTSVSLADILNGISADQFENVGQASRVVDQQWGRIARTLEDVARAQAQVEAKKRPSRD